MNVPKLRFKEFTDEWQKKTLKSVSSYFKSGKSIKSNDILKNAPYPVYGGNGLRGYTNTFNFDGNASLIGRQGALCGNVTYVKGKNYMTEHAVIVQSNYDNYNKFLFYILLSMNLNQYSTQSAQPGLSVNNLLELFNYFPNIQEQEKIAKFLTTVDKKITNLENTITSLENQKKGLLQQIFSQKLRFKDKNGNNYPNWEKKKLGDIGSFSRGGNLSKSDLSKKGTSCILYGELYTYYNEFATEIKSKTLNTTNLVLSKKYDVLLPLSGETAEDISTCTCIFFDDIALGSDLLIFRSSFFDGRFMSLLLKYKYKYKIAQIAQGKSIVHISEKNIKNINIKIPCIEEQQNIADFILIFTKKLENQKAQLEHWKQIKKGLLQQMFV